MPQALPFLWWGWHISWNILGKKEKTVEFHHRVTEKDNWFCSGYRRKGKILEKPISRRARRDRREGQCCFFPGYAGNKKAFNSAISESSSKAPFTGQAGGEYILEYHAEYLGYLLRSMVN
jgi:hypothetical protein